MTPATRVRTFEPRGERVEVILKTSRCDACGTERTSAADHRENLDALAARKAHYGGLLLGEEVLALRRRHGLTRQDAAKIFGKSTSTFLRYETEAGYPDVSTTLLLELAIEQPGVIETLAAKAGVTLETQLQNPATGADHGDPMPGSDPLAAEVSCRRWRHDG